MPPARAKRICRQNEGGGVQQSGQGRDVSHVDVAAAVCSVLAEASPIGRFEGMLFKKSETPPEASRACNTVAPAVPRMAAIGAAVVAAPAVGSKAPAVHDPRSDDVFNAMDAELIRVIEDLVHVLIGKGLIMLTDLPPRAQAKLLQRAGFRDHLQADGSLSDYVDRLDDSKFGFLR